MRAPAPVGPGVMRVTTATCMPMRWLVNRALFGLPLVAVLFLNAPTRLSAMPVRLYVGNVATSVWDTDPTKVGVSLQIGNDGTAPAEDVRVTAVVVPGGAFSGPSPLPIALGTIEPNGSAVLDLLITVPRTDGAAYRLTVTGTYSHRGNARDFSLNRTIAPNSAGPGPIPAQHGDTAKGSDVHPPAGAPPPSAASPPLGPNAMTPMMIPVGPPRQVIPLKPNKPD